MSVASCVIAWGEGVHALAATRGRRLPAPTPNGSAVVVVLGFRNGGTTPNRVNRWRAKIAVRTALRLATAESRVTIVCSGGAVHGSLPEATVLRDFIAGPLGWRGPLLVEDTSTSTWENVRNVLPLLEKADSIVFASNGLHAEKARLYLGRQRPDLIARVVAADDYRVGEHSLLKPLFAAVGLRKLAIIRGTTQPNRTAM